MKTKKVKSFEIKKSRWIRGDEDWGELLNDKNKMCCLGFYSRACGLKPCDIKGIGMPSDVEEENDVKIPEEMSWLLSNRSVSGDSKDASSLAKINDKENISDEEREKKIKEIFAKHGVKVKFIK